MRKRQLALRFDRRVPKQLARLPRRDAERVLNAIEGLQTWPPDAADIRALSGEFKGLYRLRVGEWRVQFDVDLEADMLHVLSVTPRQRAY
ncbi:MAG: type II toxin-antitoxin system RelE/ParE family toxin [Armatimonadia bacterium]